MIEMKSCIDVLKYQSVIPCECTAPLILESVDKNDVLGYIVFEYLENEVVIYAIESGDDLAVCDGLVRSAMLKALLNGIKFARFSLKTGVAEKHCQKLGFIEKNQAIADIDKILNACKGCRQS